MTETTVLQRLVRVTDEISERVSEMIRDDNSPPEESAFNARALQLCEAALSTLRLQESCGEELPVGMNLAVSRVVGSEPDPSVAGEEPSGSLRDTSQLEPGLAGESSTIPLAFVVQMVRSQDGILMVHTEDETASVVFQNGYVVHASSDCAPVGSRLGEILVERLVIDEERLRKFLDGHRDQRGHLGKALCDVELVSAEDLTGALDTQVQRLFARLLRAKQARFGFFEGLPPHLDRRIRLDVGELLLEGSAPQDQPA